MLVTELYGVDAAASPELEETANLGSWGGSTYAYRGARIECQKGGHVRTLRMSDHPLNGLGFGCVSPRRRPNP